MSGGGDIDARRFWESVFRDRATTNVAPESLVIDGVVVTNDPNSPSFAAEFADESLAEWRKRWEPAPGGPCTCIEGRKALDDDIALLTDPECPAHGRLTEHAPSAEAVVAAPAASAICFGCHHVAMAHHWEWPYGCHDCACTGFVREVGPAPRPNSNRAGG